MSMNTSRRDFIRWSSLAAGAVAAPGLLTACSGRDSGGGSDKFKIGAVIELSGESVTGGTVAKRGYELWAKMVNEKGGITIGDKSYQVELIIQDCQSQPAVAAQVAERLVSQEGVDVLFGSYTSGAQIAMNPIVEKYQVPCIAGSAESPDNWKPQPKFTYGIIPAVDLTSGKSIQALVDTASPAPASAVVVGINEPFSDATAYGFRDGVEAAGLELADFTLFPVNADLAPIANNIKAKNPDIVAVGGHDVALVDVVKALKAVQFTPKAIIEHYGVTDSSFAKALGKDADGVLGISVWLPDAPTSDDFFGTSQDYAKAFSEEYGAEPDYTSAGCSAAGLVLEKALQELGEPPSLSQESKVKLNDILAKTDLETFYGRVQFASEGDHFHNNTALEPILVQVQDGQIAAVVPPDDSDAQLIYPLPDLNDR